MHHTCAWCLSRTGSVGVPGSGDSGGSELPDGGTGNRTWASRGAERAFGHRALSPAPSSHVLS